MRVDGEKHEPRLGTGQGTRGKGQENREGETPAEPKTAANSEERMANDFSGRHRSCTAEKLGVDTCTPHLAPNIALRT